MEAFEYTSLDAAGKQRKGIIQADNEKQARHLLRQQSLTPIQVDQVLHHETATTGGERVQRLVMKKHELPLFIRQLATLVQAGLPLDDALKTLIDQSENKSESNTSYFSKFFTFW